MAAERIIIRVLLLPKDEVENIFSAFLQTRIVSRIRLDGTEQTQIVLSSDSSPFDDAKNVYFTIVLVGHVTSYATKSTTIITEQS